MLHLSPFLVFWHKMNTLNTNMFWGSILPFLSEYIFLCYAKSCHEHSSCIYTTVKELIEPLVTHKGTYTHAHAKAKSPRNGLVYLCWGWKTLENHYFLFRSLCTWSVWQNGTDLSENVILRGIFDFLKASVLLNTFSYMTTQWGFWQ